MSGSCFSCSFCGKGTREVRRVIVGPNVGICNECVDVCMDILAHPDCFNVINQDADITRHLFTGQAGRRRG